MKKLIVIGAGDGGRVVSRLVEESGQYELSGFIDDDIAKQDKSICGYKVIATSSDMDKFCGAPFVVSIGTDMKARSLLFERALNAGLEPVNLIHKSAVIDHSAQIGRGIIILANSVIGAFSHIGNNVFVFTGTILEHDAKIGDNVYFSPGVSLAGHVQVGENTFFGINSCVTEGIRVGRNVTVGAGSVVLKDTDDNVVIAGVPAKALKR